MKPNLLILASFAAAVIVGVTACVSVAPGNDPLVVHAEQSETIGIAAFDLVVQTDNANRPFWITNAPPFHAFAEWLRAPMTIEGTNVFPRGVAIVKQLDDVKLAYKAGSASSNVLVTILTTFDATVAVSQSWITITKNTTH